MARLLHLVLACILGLLAFAPAHADDFRPAYLQLTERGPETYDYRWKTPAQDEQSVLPVRPIYPPGTSALGPAVASYSSGTAVIAGRIAVPGGLPGKQLRFDGLAGSRNEVLVRLIRADGSEELSKVTSANPQLAIPAAPGAFGVSARYTGLGIEHILLGFDHLLFVAALVMLVGNLRMLVWTITSFTLAHSITLALVTLDVIAVPVPPVEAFIALSIVFVAVEVVRTGRGEESLASRKPWLVAFAFGLLHGLGFASALAEAGLPQDNVPLALLFFNLGVELGQLAFVLGLIALSRLASRVAADKPLSSARLAASYAIGGLASYWLIDRVLAFA